MVCCFDWYLVRMCEEYSEIAESKHCFRRISWLNSAGMGEYFGLYIACAKRLAFLLCLTGLFEFMDAISNYLAGSVLSVTAVPFTCHSA